MRTFTSADKGLRLSHTALKQAVGSVRFVLAFDDGKFATANDALADALLFLAVPGVVETTPRPEPKVVKPIAPAKPPKPAKKDEE